jgi:hypothetical protein
MAHGYLRDWDEDWGRRERAEREWRGPDGDWGDREGRRSFMLSDYDRRARNFGPDYGGRGDWERAPRNFSSNPDDHYLSWRDRHMAALDRDYADYCREREEEFHRDFDSWRRERRGNPEPLRTGMTQTGISHDPSGITEQQTDDEPFTASEPDPVSDATLGANSSDRGRKR